MAAEVSIGDLREGIDGLSVVTVPHPDKPRATT